MTTIQLSGGSLGEGFGVSQDTLSAPGADDGVYRLIDLVSPQGSTFTALDIRRWQSDQVSFKVTDFFEDSSPGNFIQDESEPAIAACSDLELGNYSVYVRYVSYRDDDHSGNFTQGDTVLQVAADPPFTFEFTEEPFVSKLKPKSCVNGTRLRLVGANFGDAQTDGEVRIGRRSDATDPALGQGKVLKVRKWSDGRIVVRLKVRAEWEGKNRFVWIEKDGVKSRYKKLQILAPSP
jgi:hypothetical protein